MLVRMPRMLLWAASLVMSTVLGVGWAGFGTAAGRDLLTRLVTSVATGAIHGTVAVAGIGGSVLEGMVIEDLVIRGEDDRLLLRVPRLVLRYRLGDFLSGRVVLGRITLSDPQIELYKYPDGRFNYQEIFGLGGPREGPPPLIAFRDAAITGGRVTIRTPTPPPGPDDTFRTETDATGLLRVRTIDSLSARLSYVRLASPFFRERGVRLDIDTLRARISDPGLDLRDLRGRIDIDGDSLRIDAPRLALPGSEGRVAGTMHWPDGRMQFDLDIVAARWRVEDARGLVRRLPWGMTGRGTLRLHSVNAESLAVTLEPMRLQGPRDGGAVTGRFSGVFANKQMVALTRTDLSLDRLDLEFVRPLLDTLPLAGRLSGTLRADGPTNLLNVDLDWHFADSLAAPGSWPVTDIRGRGFMAVGREQGIAFLGFDIDSADGDFATLQRLFPAVRLEGRLLGAGTLRGEWRNADFVGALAHLAPGGPASQAHGTVRFDSRRDTLGVFADLVFDSLRLAGMHPFYPQLPPAGVLAGSIRLAGFVDSLPMDLDLAGPSGVVRGRATVVLLRELSAMRHIDAVLTGLNVGALYDRGVPTGLSGTVRGRLELDSAGSLATNVRYTLGASDLAGTPVDSARGRFSLVDSLASVSGTMWGPGLRVVADGSLGLAAGRSGALTIDGTDDSVRVLRPLIETLVPVAARRGLLAGIGGSARARVRLDGAVTDYEAQLAVSIEGVHGDSIALQGVELEAAWSSAFDRPITVRARGDSIAIGRYALSDIVFERTGLRRVSTWWSRARMGLEASWIAWGQAYADPQVLILPLDSMAVLLPEHVWHLTEGALVSASDSGFLFRNFTLESDNDSARIGLEGLFPTNGAAAFTTTFAAFPVRDLWGALQLDSREVDGTVSGSIDLGGTAPAPVMHADLTVRDAVYRAARVPLLTGSADYRDRRLQGTFDMDRDGERIAEIDLDLPIDLAIRGAGERLIDGELSIRARADSVDLAFVDLFFNTVRDVSGTLRADFGVAGSWGQPRLTGTASIAGGRARYPRLRVTHHDVFAGVHLSGDSIVVDSLRVRSGGGEATAAGVVRLEDLRRPYLDLHIRADNVFAADIPGLVKFTTSGDVDLRGPVLEATLTGEGTVTEGVLYFADFIKKDIVNLEDTLYTQLLDPSLRALITEEGLGASLENRFLSGLLIRDLALEMGNAVWLRSDEANIRLSGRLTVAKTGDAYRYEGTLNTPQGNYRLPLAGVGGTSKDFTVTGGEVIYFGTPDLNAALNINAQRQVRTIDGDNLTVLVHVGGTLYEPEVTLSSDRPTPLPTTEIISYLLFGVPSVEALGAQSPDSRQSAWRSALGNFALDVGFGQLSTELERSLIADLGVPIDYLRIQPQGLAGVGVSVGRRVGDNWFLIVSPRVCRVVNNNVSALGFFGRVEYRLSRSWRWSFSRDPSTPCGTFTNSVIDATRPQWGTDLIWERRY